MRVVIVGLGNQGNKRKAVAGEDVVATVDPCVPGALYKTVQEVSLDAFDAAFVCTPDQQKPDILRYLLSHGKHVLVEKPLLTADGVDLHQLDEIARRHRVACYTAYNHRFEPHIVRLKELLESQALGDIYLARFFYGNGTAMDVRRSAWRDQGLGVLSDLGSHLLDLALFLFGKTDSPFSLWNLNRFENRASDHALFGSSGRPVLEMEATLLSWRNTFTIDVYGEMGSAHVDCLCKWGPSTFIVRKRVFPSGRPEEEAQTVEGPDPTWGLEYRHFQNLCAVGGTNIENDLWINERLAEMAQTACIGIPL